MSQTFLELFAKKVAQAQADKHNQGRNNMADRKDNQNACAKDDGTPSASKKRRATATPSIEEEFEVAPGGKSKCFKCKHCSMMLILDSADSALEMKSHLETCAQFLSGGTKLTSESNPEVYKELVTLAIVRHGYSLNFPEQCGYRDIHAYLNQYVNPISLEASTAHCLELFKKEKEKLKQTFQSIPSRVCVTCDVFTDTSTVQYLCLSAHYVDSNWKLMSKLLNLHRLDPRDYFGGLLWTTRRLLRDWHIGKKLVTVTLNLNGQKLWHRNECDLEFLGFCSHRKDQPCDSEFLHVHCCSLFLDLIAQEAFKTISVPIIRIRKEMNYLFASETRRLKFAESAKLYEVDCSEWFWLDSPARWDSTYRMLEGVLKNHHFFNMTIFGTEGADDLCIVEKDWSRIDRICKILRPLYELTDLFAGHEYHTSNSYFINIWRTGLRLLEAMRDTDPDICDMAQKLKTIFDDYWDHNGAMLASAIVFDPRYKLRFVKFCYQKLDEATAAERCTSIRSQLDWLFQAYLKKRSTPSDTKFSQTEFKEWEKEEQVYEVNSQLEVYLNERRVDSQGQMDVLSWWKENQHRFPDLSLMAIDILSVPLATFSSDSAFNMGNKLVHKLKSSWLTEYTEALVATRNWLYGYQVDANEVRELVGANIEFPKPKVAQKSTPKTSNVKKER